MDISLFDYHLPKKRIAQTPARPRDASRLFVLDIHSGIRHHRAFHEIEQFLKEGDVLVINNTKVFPARLSAKKETGGKVEIFLLKDLGRRAWEALLKNAGQKDLGKTLLLKEGLKARPIEKKDGTWTIAFNKQGVPLKKLLDRIGETPTPPYIKTRSPLADYQTTYAKRTGSVAAPTAGFHFSKKLINRLKSRGIRFAEVTLHVGLGTFEPVREKDVTRHRMHAEHASLNAKTAARINKAKALGGKIIAVGTTSARVLESFADEMGYLRHGSKETGLFILPGYRFRMIDGLITNFHLPKSTLLMMASAFIAHKNGGSGVPKELFAAYEEAIKKKYRFYSFGDAMFIC